MKSSGGVLADSGVAQTHDHGENAFGSTASDELSECLMVFNLCAGLPFPSFPRFKIFDEVQNGGFSNSSINCKTMASCRRTGPGRRVWASRAGLVLLCPVIGQ